MDAESRKEMFVGGVLLLSSGEVDGLAFDEGEFATGESWANGAGDGVEHRESLARSVSGSRALKAAAVADRLARGVYRSDG